MRHLARFDLNLLRIFDAIFARGGVSAAARHLNLSQPAISHALAKLRDTFDDPLFVRQGNRLVPTPAARAIAGPVREALRGLDVALDAATSFDPAEATREFRIGVRLSGEMPRFSSLVARVRSEAPHVALASVTFRRRDLVMTLANGDLDLALDVGLPADDRLRSQYLGTEPIVVAARKGHPRVDGAIDLDTYLSLEHIIATARPYGPGLEDMALERMGLVRRVAVRCQHAITAWQIVASSDMLFALPRSHAEVLDAMWPMQLVELPLPVEQSGSYLYWHQAAQADPGLAWLRAIIVEELGATGKSFA
ncbi:LysR family transcriptional regulator [Sphingopyxis witflariensis]|uniref:LysR family transcriptional regulator n=1 Tax=Sphingopyxis witflariensis TaxID=173675 RepID=A0A2D0AMV5_9SPHN|nr:LysR family transcriptional regulator [Sphingopyxis witflariensis]OWQ95090.1 LysR family transcriptional regulator [Sphingopyxis witflariensis]